ARPLGRRRVLRLYGLGRLGEAGGGWVLGWGFVVPPPAAGRRRGGTVGFAPAPTRGRGRRRGARPVERVRRPPVRRRVRRVRTQADLLDGAARRGSRVARAVLRARPLEPPADATRRPQRAQPGGAGAHP